MIEITDAAVQKCIQRTEDRHMKLIRLGVTSGGCVGFEYVIEYADESNGDDVAFDYGKFSIVINEESLPYLEECTLDWTKEGLNEYFKIINPKEVSSCGCGVSIGFDPLP